jgi:hypothetical protein
MDNCFSVRSKFRHSKLGLDIYHETSIENFITFSSMHHDYAHAVFIS